MEQHKINSIDKMKAFALAGNAYFTLVNNERGTRLTFRFNKPKKHEGDNPPVFASVLSGPENTTDYSFLGTIWKSGNEVTYRHGSRSKVGTDTASVRTVQWFVNHLNAGRELPGTVEFYHAGRCGRCGKMLTVPESIETGLGPICEGL